VRIDVEGPGHRLELDHRVESQLFGIGREALTNVAKHAQASRATVRVEERAERAIVEIRDDGCGFDPTGSPTGHYGLQSMRSRAAEIDAVLTIMSSPGGGTVIQIEVPLGARQSDDTRD
jgi:signal transduction histidine kinase